MEHPQHRIFPNGQMGQLAALPFLRGQYNEGVHMGHIKARAICQCEPACDIISLCAFDACYMECSHLWHVHRSFDPLCRDFQGPDWRGGLYDVCSSMPNLWSRSTGVFFIRFRSNGLAYRE